METLLESSPNFRKSRDFKGFFTHFYLKNQQGYRLLSQNDHLTASMPSITLFRSLQILKINLSSKKLISKMSRTSTHTENIANNSRSRDSLVKHHDYESLFSFRFSKTCSKALDLYKPQVDSKSSSIDFSVFFNLPGVHGIRF